MSWRRAISQPRGSLHFLCSRACPQSRSRQVARSVKAALMCRTATKSEKQSCCHNTWAPNMPRSCRVTCASQVWLGVRTQAHQQLLLRRSPVPRSNSNSNNHNMHHLPLNCLVPSRNMPLRRRAWWAHHSMAVQEEALRHLRSTWHIHLAKWDAFRKSSWDCGPPRCSVTPRRYHRVARPSYRDRKRLNTITRVRAQ
jgi:hypothetical protein